MGMGRGASISLNAKRRGADGSITDQEWTDICRRYGFRCAICRRPDKLTADHIIPVSKGGTTSPDNIRPLCEKCNKDKADAGVGDKEVWDRMPMEALDLLREEAFDRLRSVETQLGAMPKHAKKHGDPKRSRLIKSKETIIRELRELKAYIADRNRSQGYTLEADVMTAALVARKDPGELLSMTRAELDQWREVCRNAAKRVTTPEDDEPDPSM